MTSTSLKVITLCGAAAALAAMGVATVQAGSTGAGSSAVVATNLTPVTTTAPKYGRVVKPTPFAGGDWPGMGSFGEGWAK